MSRGTKLQEMEVKTQQSKTVVNANAKPADPMPTMADPGTQLGNVEDLGGLLHLKIPNQTMIQIS